MAISERTPPHPATTKPTCDMYISDIYIYIYIANVAIDDLPLHEHNSNLKAEGGVCAVQDRRSVARVAMAAGGVPDLRLMALFAFLILSTSHGKYAHIYNVLLFFILFLTFFYRFSIILMK
jgi:hypothetical protein